MAGSKTTHKNKHDDLVIIAIGSSAGGLDALYKVIEGMPNRLENAAVIIAQHLSPTYESQLVKLLAKKTPLEVMAVTDGVRIKPKTIYVTPRDQEIFFEKGKFCLVREQDGKLNQPKPSIDYLFQSLVADRKKNVIGIMLSGSNKDGTGGIQAIKQAGGYTIAQEPQTAEFKIMPVSAIDSGFIDYVLPPDEIGKVIGTLVEELHSMDENLIKSLNKTEAQDEILKLLSKRSKTNFEDYKPTTIFRRLHKRLNELNISDFKDYLAYIKKQPQEIDALFNTILIGVTSFFRDKESFEVLEKHLKKMIVSKSRDDSIRIWVPGCATGEEPYSISIILHRLLKNRYNDIHVQIFATDIDEKALTTARKGVYTKESLANVDPEIISEYFTKKGKTYSVNKTIRSSIVFSKHDVTVNPPFLRLDLISCRNLFIYFSSALQKQILPIFHFAINKDGYLFLGKAETVGSNSDRFSVVDAKIKLYQRKRGNKNKALPFANFKTQRFEKLKTTSGEKDHSITEIVKDTLFAAYPNPYVVINDNMDILEIRGDVHDFLGLREGNMDTNIFRMARQSLQIDLRTIISKAANENVLASTRFKRISINSTPLYVRISARPLVGGRSNNQLFLVSFEKKTPDETEPRHAPDSDDENPRIIELQQELIATKENMQRYIEQLEISNEELQSLNEEMQSTYEELHTSNEELESTNEELQSSYDEIQSNYSELQAAKENIEKKETELRKSESNTWALLNNTLQSFVLIDRQYTIITFNKKARKIYRELLGREMKKGKSFINFITAENTESFRNDLDKVFEAETISGIQTMKDNNGKIHWFRYNYSPVIKIDGDVEGATCSILDITAEKKAQHDLKKSEQLNELFFESPGVGVILTDENGIIYRVNEMYCKMSGYDREELLGKPYTLNVIPSDRKKAMQNYRKFTQGAEIEDESRLYTKNKQIIDVLTTGILVTDPENKRFKLTTVREITDQKNYQAQLKQSLKEKEYMLQEIHHRVKNNMAVITGLLSLQADNLEDEKIKRIYRESENRIRSIAMIHEKLYQSQDFTAIEMKSYIKELMEMIVALIQPEADVKSSINTENVYLNINLAVPCGLIIHELLTNAFEHAFKGKKKGKISVNFTHIDNMYKLDVEDNGVGLPKDLNQKNGKNLGMNLIHGLARQLHAHVDICREKGTKVTIQFKGK